MGFLCGFFFGGGREGELCVCVGGVLCVISGGGGGG